MPNIWVEYDRWDSAFSHVVYGGARAHEPVFLDVEDDLLVEVARQRGLAMSAEAAEAALGADVRQTLMLGAADSGFGVLSRHRERLDRWRWQRTRPGADSSVAPPVIAVLAVFARAAELMAKDDTYRSTAYFPRLHQLLKVEPRDESRLYAAYSHECERFWGSLNGWLDSMGGAQGVPTAEAIGRRYVGIALSQALIRDADRQLLPQFFASRDLEPGLRLGHEDMAAYLDSWVKEGHGSGSMRSLMRNAAGRKVLAEAAALTLAQWDGTTQSRDRTARDVPSPLLTARIARKGLGGARLDLGFALRGSLVGARSVPRLWSVLSAACDPKPEVEVSAITDRLVAPDLPEDVDGVSLLTGQLRLQAVVDEDDRQQVLRRPQPVVILTHVEEAGLFVEVERARLLESHMVLANAAARRPNGTPPFDLDQLLEEIAQPGFIKLDQVAGLPAGWVLYRDVVVARRHDRPDFVLDPLKPAQTSALTVSGGLRLPGHAARWHVDVPLDLRGTVGDARSLQVTLASMEVDDAAEQVVKEWATDEVELVETTEALALAPGRYRSELRAVGASRKDDATSIVTFALCSSDEPRVRAVPTALAYDPDAEGGCLGATLVTGSGSDERSRAPHLVRGAVSALEGPEPGITEVLSPERVWWSHATVRTERQVLAEPAGPDSCAITAIHNEKIETHQKGMKYNRAVCIRCGHVKLYRPIAPMKKPQLSSVASVKHPLAHLRSVHQVRAIGGDTLLDALAWIGGGSSYEIAHLVRQIHDSALTVDEIVRALEALGHLDVSRDPTTFALQEWSLGPRALAGLEDGTWFLTGSWSRSSLTRLERAVCTRGGVLGVDEDGWLPRRRLLGLEPDAVDEIGKGLAAAVVPDAGRRLLASLVPLAWSADSLHRVSAEGIFDAEWFNPTTTTWTVTQSIGQPGAYRVPRGFVKAYLFRSPQDVERRTAACASSQVVKHLANARRPLVGYDPETQRLFVPLGADLPGLYGRALSLMSGLPPAQVSGEPLLVYQCVAPDVASTLVGLLKE